VSIRASLFIFAGVPRRNASQQGFLVGKKEKSNPTSSSIPQFQMGTYAFISIIQFLKNRKPKEKKKPPSFAREDPFTELAKLQKTHRRKTKKDTRMPKSQFYWGRHRGPKG
jgi:hypothetical protein